MAMRNREDDGMITKVVSINRVSKTVKGGRIMKFAALVVVGDGKGTIGYGIGKSGEVPEAIRKGEAAAKKNMHKVALKGTTIPHEIVGKYGAGAVLLKPAAPGTGMIAGGPVRAVIEAAGIKDVRAKSMRSNNPINVVAAPYFRKVFDARKKIWSARAYIAVAGLYELYINGEKIGNHRLDPLYTRFDRRNFYVTYDITSQIQKGKNAIGVLLGNGWYNHQSMAVWDFHRAPWRNRPAFCMDVRITYEDGSVEVVSTERDWKTSSGALIFNSIYTAEHYDARLEQKGWNTVNFDDSKWNGVGYRAVPSQNVVSQQVQPIRAVETIPVKI